MNEEQKYTPNFLQVPNAVIDELIADLTGAELKCYLVVIRKTKGWNKEQDSISISQFMEVTGLSNRKVIDACDHLVELGLLDFKTGSRGVKLYSVKSYKISTREKSSQVKKVHSTREESSQVTSEESSHTINNIKNTIQNTNNNSTSEQIRTAAKRKLNFTDDDLKCATWMFSQLKKLNPGHTQPEFDKWANQIRIIRERDDRTHKQICELFQFANQHHFWFKNILSPESLRKKWDVLTIEKNNQPPKRANQTVGGFIPDDESNWGEGLTIYVKGQ